ncbi:DUF2637 domain-containing protein [Kitasatospora sp. NBC_01287]|uniref:DUF2637 domain-containing protein n=1 Tax=Kitasatospora sp. NBC_01287 TaxID=2903573 RepID=UPI0022507345|nr:DUF2637 domain-containing protein [Kitasatospora sp. NBC_01287]MCX4751223.1 DUF2637 domain-containing protein [Kitasatospora sp. NBC_01287]
MSTATATAPTSAHITGWDRAVVIALGAAGCALSYDALQQMAVAIHVRGLLTFVFPLVIDGFIAYGVRALLVMRDAPLPARAYCWTLFGAATTASLWANALHAVRLNQQDATTGGLRLGDTVVAVLSTIAPLALAGAVHLYILIARGPVTDADRDRQSDRSRQGQRGQVTDPADRDKPVTALTDGTDSAQLTSGHSGADQPVSGWVTAPADRPMLTLAKPVTLTAGQPAPARPVSGWVTAPADRPMLTLATPVTVTVTDRADLGGQPESASAVSDRPAKEEPVTAQPVSVPGLPGQPVSPSVTQPQVTDPADRDSGDRRADLDTEELLEIAREAVKAEDKLTRRVVAGAIRGQRIPLSSDTLTQLMAQLREQHGQPVTVSRD